MVVAMETALGCKLHPKRPLRVNEILCSFGAVSHNFGTAMWQVPYKLQELTDSVKAYTKEVKGLDTGYLMCKN